ncbi:hypothetical protein AAG906_033950 [Vitis piasezkii]
MEGDRNTGYFHRMTNAHKRRNWLVKIKINSSWLLEENEIKEEWLGLEGLDFERIGAKDVVRLEEAFNEGEVFSALFELNGDKALELDGGADDLRDIRPISLVGGLYKLLAKVLANRLKKKWAGWIRWGLRQGDPLSPYLFVIRMEALSYLINRVVSEGFLLGCRVWGRGGEGVQVTHLLVENVEDLALELGCKVGALPSSYLGLPLGVAHKLVAVWDGVEERFRKRLAMWKRQFISKGGRIYSHSEYFVKYAHIFHVLLRMPRVVRLTLEKIQRDFLVGGGGLEKKPYLVKWEIVCLDKRKGGLGVRNLSNLNRALLGKWSWRFMEERGTLWKQVISRKYGMEEEGWGTRKVREGMVWGFGKK